MPRESTVASLGLQRVEVQVVRGPRAAGGVGEEGWNTAYISLTKPGTLGLCPA